VYVTHDQTEAMTLGDRVAVMRAGILQQVGAPQELYDDPANIFVAGFIGSPSMNFMPAQVEDGRVKLPMVEAQANGGLGEAARGGQGLIAGIRPEHFDEAARVPQDRRSAGATFRAKIELVESLGSELYAHFSIEHAGVESQELQELAADAGTAEVPGAGQDKVVARLDSESGIRQGEETELWVDTSRIHFFDPATGGRLRHGGVSAPA
jgi:multiple sugar transport system ATP-binding protein